MLTWKYRCLYRHTHKDYKDMQNVKDGFVFFPLGFLVFTHFLKSIDFFFSWTEEKSNQCILKIMFPLTFPNSYIHPLFIHGLTTTLRLPRGSLAVIPCRPSSHTRKTNENQNRKPLSSDATSRPGCSRQWDPHLAVNDLGHCSQAPGLNSNSQCWDFPGGPVVKTQRFHCRAAGSIPGRGTKIPHAARWGQNKQRNKKFPMFPQTPTEFRTLPPTPWKLQVCPSLPSSTL